MTEASKDRKKNGRRWRWFAVGTLAAVGCICAVYALRRRPESEPPSATDALDVPLGVEEAVIIRYAGPRLVARPYRRGASINLRIADRFDRDGLSVYDVRYVVNLPGEFELTDYLTSADGAPLEGLPSFRVRGQTRLTKTIETRIREIEKVRIDIWHGYYETLAGLGILWALWLLGLIFIGRPKRAARRATVAPPPSVEQRLAGLLRRLAECGLTLAEKVELERLLLCYWKDRFAGDRRARLAQACRCLRQRPETAEALETLQAWLHRPASRVDPGQVVAACEPSLCGPMEETP